jgi:hypothetical protein
MYTFLTTMAQKRQENFKKWSTSNIHLRKKKHIAKVYIGFHLENFVFPSHGGGIRRG